MSKRDALATARRDEIINACAALYETMSFKDITIKEIGRRTSFTRTSIYNYFQTKEEIFLALIQREYEAWITDLESMLHGNGGMSMEEFSDELAHTLERRELLLKLMSMNHYDMEANSRMENLVAFKMAYGNSMRAVTCCLEKFFPQMTIGNIQRFIYAFFPFMFGIYPYTVVTDKQRGALQEARADYVFLSIYEITKSTVENLLLGLNRPMLCGQHKKP